jgi:transcriptional regulator NrdR family protein
MSEREKGPKVKCPACRWEFSEILPRHPSSTLAGFARWRRCDECGTIYETVEAPTRIVPQKPLDVAGQ